MKHSCKKCSSRCNYYPYAYEDVTNEYIDVDGLKHRDGTLRCRYDNHKITKFVVCKNYLDFTKE